jgi:hypothetical protein
MHSINEVRLYILVEIMPDANLDTRPGQFLRSSAYHSFGIDRENKSCRSGRIGKR